MGNAKYIEQILGPHSAGYPLSTSFILEEHTMHSVDKTHQITISRKLSSSVEIDEYWLFSCEEAQIDIIWSVGKSTKFERHIAFGQDRLKYQMTERADYDKSKIVDNVQPFTLRINWTSVFILSCLGFIAFYLVKKYKQNIMDFCNQQRSSYPANSTNQTTTNSQYGSAADSEPLLNKL